MIKIKNKVWKEEIKHVSNKIWATICTTMKNKNERPISQVSNFWKLFFSKRSKNVNFDLQIYPVLGSKPTFETGWFAMSISLTVISPPFAYCNNREGKKEEEKYEIWSPVLDSADSCPLSFSLKSSPDPLNFKFKCKKERNVLNSHKNHETVIASKPYLLSLFAAP